MLSYCGLMEGYGFFLNWGFLIDADGIGLITFI